MAFSVSLQWYICFQFFEDALPNIAPFDRSDIQVFNILKSFISQRFATGLVEIQQCQMHSVTSRASGFSSVCLISKPHASLSGQVLNARDGCAHFHGIHYIIRRPFVHLSDRETLAQVHTIFSDSSAKRRLAFSSSQDLTPLC